MFSRIDIDTILLMLIQDVYINTPLKFPYSFYRKKWIQRQAFPTSELGITIRIF